jgi:hypothetical protein
MPLKESLENFINDGDDVIDFNFLKIRKKTIYVQCCWNVHELSYPC